MEWSAARWRILYAIGMFLEKVPDVDELSGVSDELMENRYLNALQAVSAAKDENSRVPAIRNLIAVTGELVARECGFKTSDFIQ